MKNTKTRWTTLCLAAAIALPLSAAEQPEAVRRISTAQTVLREIMTAPDESIPQDLLDKAHCIIIVPGVKRAGFIFGGHYGKGVALCRADGRHGWTGPSTVRLEGGSFGLQIGGSEADIVMLVMNERGAQKLMKSKFTLGGNAQVAAGPVGRDARAETDAYMHAEILAWSRTRGLFAGLTLSGGTLRPDNDDNAQIYGHPVAHAAVLNGQVRPPVAAEGLRAYLNKFSPVEARNRRG